MTKNCLFLAARMRDKKFFLIILITALFVFLPFLLYGRQQGFFWDDWSQLLLHEKYGDDVFPKYFSYDRPFSAWTHILFFPLCGNSFVRWHSLFSLIRYAGIGVTWLMLRKICSKNDIIPDVTVLLLSVCPLFSQYHISIAYSQHYIDWTLFMISILLLIEAAEKKGALSIVLCVLSLLCTAAHLSITEYFAFQELLKPVILLCFDIGRSKKKNKGLSLLSAAVFFVYVLIRSQIAQWDPNFNANTPRLLELLKNDMPAAIMSGIKNTVSDLYYLFIGFTGKLLSKDPSVFFTKSGILVAAVSFIFTSLVFAYLSFYDKLHQSKKTARLFILAVFGIITGIVPFWVMNENFFASVDPAHADRCFLAAMPWFCLFISVLLYLLFPEKKRFSAAAAAAVLVFSFSFMLDSRQAVYETKKQQRFFSQFNERVPGLLGDTAIVSDYPVFEANGNFSTSSALNLIYADQNLSMDKNLPVWMFGSYGKYIDNNRFFSVQKRNYSFSSSDFIYIIADHPFSNCVWFPIPEDIGAPYLSDEQISWIRNSNLKNIDTAMSSSSLDASVFGEIPTGSWCSYYQRASLLRQKKDWNGLTELYAEVTSSGYSPENVSSNSPFEWVPFIVGLRNSGEISAAERLIEKCIEVDSAYSGWIRNINQ